MHDFRKTVRQSIHDISIEDINLFPGKIYFEIGFDTVDSTLLKQLVLIPLSHHASKLKTSQYLQSYFATCISEDKIYRYLDKLHFNYKETLQHISYSHTKMIFGGDVSIVFCDVTTIYFQIDNEDEI